MKKNKISASVIGMSGQAAKIIGTFKKMPGVELRYVYYPKKLKTASALPLTDDFDKILTSDAIIIASPTDTHAGYLKKLKNYRGYILVEKPAVSTGAETAEIKKYPASWQKRVKINFNFQHSKMSEILTSLIKGSEIGEPVFLSIYTSHGLAFSEKYQGSWRADAKKSFGVLELVGVHFINFALYLGGSIKNFQAEGKWLAKKEKKLPPDTVSLSLEMANGLRVNLYHSYAGPAFNRILMAGTNGYFEYDGKTAKIYSPRETYDLNGRFITPPVAKIYRLNWADAWEESLIYSLKDFFTVAKKKKSFSLDKFRNGLAAMEPIFYLKNKFK